MKKKIQNYSWIHELNQAALESKLLSEAREFAKQVELYEARKGVMGGGSQTERFPGNPSEEETASANIGRFLRDIGFNRETIARNAPTIVGLGKQLTSGSRPAMNQPPEGIFADISLQRQFQQAKRDMIPADVDGDGFRTAKDVEADVKDFVVGNEDSPVDSSMMGRYPSIQKGMKMGSLHSKGDEIEKNMLSSIDAEIERRIKTLPPGRQPNIQDLHNIARALGETL